MTMGATQGEKVQPLIAIQLHEALEEARQGRYADALTVVREARASESRNIYVIAFQKQIEKLLDMSRGGTTHGQQHSEIVQSLPPIVERAIQSSRNPLRPVSTPPPAGSVEKEAALENLERMYLHRADEYLDKGDYDHAMAEVRRVYIIHPASLEAKKYEKRIETGIALQSSTPPDAPPVAPKRESKPFIESPVHTEARGAGEQDSSRRRESRAHEHIARPRRSRSRKALWMIISSIVVLIILLGGYLFLSKGNPDGNMQRTQDGSQQSANSGNAAPPQQEISRDAQVENIQITPPDRTGSDNAAREKGGLSLQVQYERNNVPPEDGGSKRLHEIVPP